MKTLLSTVTPVYRGELYLEELVRSLAEFKKRLISADSPIDLAEAIFVIDDASDNSAAVLNRLKKELNWIRVIHLSNNFGQHPATMAGILFSVGHWIVTLDEDLQHHPKHILTMLEEAVINQADIVYAQSTIKVHGQFRDFSSKLVKKVLGVISANPHVTQFNSFRVVRGDIARAAAALATSNTYFDIALVWFSNRVRTCALPLVEQRQINDQRSNYSFGKLLGHAIRLAVTTENRFLKFGAIIGAIAFAVSIVLISFTLVISLFAPGFIALKGWPSLFLANLFFGGLLCLMVGIALEYIGNMYAQSQGKPTFFVVDRSVDKPLVEWLKSNRL